uniref:Uncharacterized protein n=1 Tax=Anguilla anguilla TaxID=7936 RepID=A0A0E9V7V9_ANGAN
MLVLLLAVVNYTQVFGQSLLTSIYFFSG